MSDSEQDFKSEPEQDNGDKPEPAEPEQNDTAEDLTETSGERQDPVSNTGLNASEFASDLGDDDPDENPVDPEQTADDLDGGDLASVREQEPTHAELFLTISGAEIQTDFEEEQTVEGVTSVSELHINDLERIQRVLREEAARRGVQDKRPFRDLDTDSLLVLYNAVRTELGSR